MRTAFYWLAASSLPLLTLAAFAAFAACATAEESNPVDSEDQVVLPGGDAGGEASLDADVAPIPCAVGNLCRVQTPLELGAISAMSGRSRSDVWAGGTNGLILHWDGKQWSKLDSYLNETFTSIVLTDDEMWGCAGTLLMRRTLEPNSIRSKRGVYVGISGIAALANADIYVSGIPSPILGLPIPTLGKVDFETGVIAPEPEPVHPVSNQAIPVAARALFLLPNKALWVIGDRGGVARFPVSTATDAGGSPIGQGVIFPLETQAGLNAAWARDDELWAAGTTGTIVHYDGSKWRFEETETTANLQAIFGTGRDDIWAAGDDGTVIHFDGARWSRIAIGTYRENLRAIWGSSKDDVWIGGDNAMFHWGALP